MVGNNWRWDLQYVYKISSTLCSEYSLMKIWLRIIRVLPVSMYRWFFSGRWFSGELPYQTGCHHAGTHAVIRFESSAPRLEEIFHFPPDSFEGGKRKIYLLNQFRSGLGECLLENYSGRVLVSLTMLQEPARFLYNSMASIRLDFSG